METMNQEAKIDYGLKRIFNKFLNLFAIRFPFLPGNIRARLHKLRGVQIKNIKTVFIGEDVYLDDLYPHLIQIGDNVIITNGARILTHFLDTKKLSENPNYYFRFYQGKVIIEDNVFIGSNSIITKPITIGTGAIIGANTVVTKDVPENAIIVGNPGKIIKYLDV